MKYLFVLICILFSLISTCEAHNIPIAQIDSLQYSLDIENYEKVNGQDYYMYIEVYDINTKETCILHIMTQQENKAYIVTDSVVYYKGYKYFYNEHKIGEYNESSVIGKSIEILDNKEKEM